MVNRPVLMLIVFVMIMLHRLLGFADHPTGFLPTEDQGYAIIVIFLARRRITAPLPGGVPKNQCHSQEYQGIAGWVTIGGFSILDFANVSNIYTTFIVYEAGKTRHGFEPG